MVLTVSLCVCVRVSPCSGQVLLGAVDAAVFGSGAIEALEAAVSAVQGASTAAQTGAVAVCW